MSCGMNWPLSFDGNIRERERITGKETFKKIFHNELAIVRFFKEGNRHVSPLKTG